MFVLGEQAELSFTLRRLRDLCARLTEGDALAGTALPVLLGELRRQLDSHFRAEESGDYFGTLAADCPWLARRIGRLRAEHGELLAAFDDLGAAVLDASCPGQVGRRLARLLSDFDAHERAENLLLQEFFLCDEGTAG